MKSKKYAYGVSFSTTEEMYRALKEIAEEKRMSLGEVLREIVGWHIFKENSKRGKNNGNDGKV